LATRVSPGRGGCGFWFLWRRHRLPAIRGPRLAAPGSFSPSIAYLPLLLGALVVDRIFSPPMNTQDFPPINATLNGTATVLITWGFLLIKSVPKNH